MERKEKEETHEQEEEYFEGCIEDKKGVGAPDVHVEPGGNIQNGQPLDDGSAVKALEDCFR